MGVEIQSMANQPKGDCSKIKFGVEPPNLNLSSILVIQLVSSAANHEGKWVGLSIMHCAIALRKSGVGAIGLAHPAAWLSLNQANEVVQHFMKAKKDGLITIQDGYAYPTQKLADLACENS